MVHFEAPARVFVDRATVTLTSPNPGATIRYTLDGSEPTATSPIYAEPLRLDGQVVVENESPDFISRFGQAALKRGLHPIEVRYVHGTFFVKGLELAMDSPGEPLAPVPASRLFHSEGRT